MNAQMFWIFTALNSLLLICCGFLIIRLKSAIDNLQKGLIIDLQNALAEIARKEGVIRSEKGKGRVSCFFFTEEKDHRSYFRKKHIISYKYHLIINNIPFGEPITLKEDIYGEVNKEEVNRILDDFAKPLMDSGIEVSKKLI
jgi:hypothetical protein